MSHETIAKVRTNIDNAQTKLEQVMSLLESHEATDMDDEALWASAFRLESRIESLSALL
jgi:hypothetical protein